MDEQQTKIILGSVIDEYLVNHGKQPDDEPMMIVRGTGFFGIMGYEGYAYMTPNKGATVKKVADIKVTRRFFTRDVYNIQRHF